MLRARNPAFRLSDTKELLLTGYSFMKHLDLACREKNKISWVNAKLPKALQTQNLRSK